VADALSGLGGLPDDGCADGGSTVKSRATGVVPVNLAEGIIWGTPGGVDAKKGFVLEDEQTAMSWDEALMWFKITPFSPLSTHQKLMAY
jgi:hypothetical protein